MHGMVAGHEGKPHPKLFPDGRAICNLCIGRMVDMHERTRMASASRHRQMFTAALAADKSISDFTAAHFAPRLETIVSKAAISFLGASSISRGVGYFSSMARELLPSISQKNVGEMQASGIKGGVGNNMFAPRSTYTREQSIATILRMFELMVEDS